MTWSALLGAPVLFIRSEHDWATGMANLGEPTKQNGGERRACLGRRAVKHSRARGNWRQTGKRVEWTPELMDALANSNYGRKQQQERLILHPRDVVKEHSRMVYA